MVQILEHSNSGRSMMMVHKQKIQTPDQRYEYLVDVSEKPRCICYEL